ncbi:conjugal transfer protein TraX [Paenibacillus sp. TRM 82003]|nr:conjugal transfer protein TraX [Paenibacillus sp. TRM 82003]
MLQWIAMLSMAIDHIGIVWFPDSIGWRMIGRFAFPIYVYFVSVGMTRTSNPRRYVTRLATLAVVSQVPYSLLFETWMINVIGTFLVSVGAIYLMERMPGSSLRFGWIIGAAVLLESIEFDYGAYGLLLLLIYRYGSSHGMWIAHFALNAAYIMLFQAPIQMLSLLPTILLAYTGEHTRLWIGYAAPKWLWRAFYPGHLLILYLLSP